MKHDNVSQIMNKCYQLVNCHNLIHSWSYSTKRAILHKNSAKKYDFLSDHPISQMVSPRVLQKNNRRSLYTLSIIPDAWRQLVKGSFFLFKTKQKPSLYFTNWCHISGIINKVYYIYTLFLLQFLYYCVFLFVQQSSNCQLLLFCCFSFIIRKPWWSTGIVLCSKKRNIDQKENKQYVKSLRRIKLDARIKKAVH